MDSKYKIDFANLPVYSQKHKILEALATEQVVVVESNTGSGKTTQIPVILHEAGYTKEGKVVGMTQPRRIAAFSVSDVIRAQLCHQYSDLSSNFVQYKIRFEDKTTQDTQIKIMTDGILLQEIKHDKLLSAYSVLVIDEAHERSLNIDFILGLLRNICEQRKELKIIISSATINTINFSSFYSNCPIISIEAPMFPVDIRYLNPAQTANKQDEFDSKNRYRERSKNFRDKRPKRKDSNLIIPLIVNVVEQSLNRKEGDILIFLSGEREIKDCLEKIAKLNNADTNLHLLPLYGRLDQQQQERVFDPAPVGKTKIIVATNVAETSITINNISVVIDSGKVKLNYFHYHKLTSTLTETNISQASAIQRRGRAGRTKPGICYRMYSEEEFNAMKKFTEEEIFRTDLSEIVLRMAHLDIRDFENFRLISSPTKDSLASAIALLQDMGALDNERVITEVGITMIHFPLSPVHARILVEAMQHYPDVLTSVLIILSFLTTPNPLLLPLNEELSARAMHHKFASKESDFFTNIKLFETYTNTVYEEKPDFCEKHYLDIQVLNEIVNVYDQLSDMVSQQGVFVGNKKSDEEITRAMLKGFMFNVCVHYRGSIYLNRAGEKIYIHPGSVMFDLKNYPPIIIAGEIVQTSKIFARSISWCKLEWIRPVLPNLYTELKKLMPLLANKSHLAEQKIKSKIASNTPLFFVSKSSALNMLPSSKMIGERNEALRTISKSTKMEIRLGQKTYQLDYTADKKFKILRLSWDEVQNIVKQVSVQEIRSYGKLRCDIAYNVHAVLRNIKLDNVTIFCELYGKSLPFITTLLPSISLQKVKKRAQVQAIIDIIDSSMQILVPAKSGQKPSSKHHKHKNRQQRNDYKFLSLGLNDMHELYLMPEGSFIVAIQDCLHVFSKINDIADDLRVPSAIRAHVKAVYNRYRQAYEASSNYQEI